MRHSESVLAANEAASLPCRSVIHDTLSFGILVEIPDTEQGSSVLKDILFKAYELGHSERFAGLGPVAILRLNFTDKRAELSEPAHAS